VEGRPLQDDLLVERARHGDTAAYEELVVRYQDVAFRTAWLIMQQTQEAEDVTQTAFVKAYGALHRFRSGAPFRPWLLTIVANEAKNRRRSLATEGRLDLRLRESRPRADAAPSPEAAALSHEQREMLLRAMGRLSEQDQRVLAYRYFLDLSEAEMADALGCARGTVKSRVSRALGRLREVMSAPDYDRWEANIGDR
jgi:RNA polymerase sigma-70 factor (ECF subfamily)